jgi:hypothetical protein
MNKEEIKKDIEDINQRIAYRDNYRDTDKSKAYWKNLRDLKEAELRGLEQGRKEERQKFIDAIEKACFKIIKPMNKKVYFKNINGEELEKELKKSLEEKK